MSDNWVPAEWNTITLGQHLRLENDEQWAEIKQWSDIRTLARYAAEGWQLLVRREECLTTLEKEITDLSARWFAYVNHDHHKDRDCHFYVQKRWSYGETPYYIACHDGYRAERWQSPRCATAEAAQRCLRDFLKREIEKAINYTQSAIEELTTTRCSGIAWSSCSRSCQH